MPQQNYDIEFDATALRCPLPLALTKQKLASMRIGQTIRVLTRDKSSLLDFKVYTEVAGQALLQAEQRSEIYYIHIKKLK